MSVKAEEIQSKILSSLDKTNGIPNTAKDSYFKSLDIEQVENVLKSLSSRNMVAYKRLEEEVWDLTKEGQEIAENGSHEVRVFNFIPTGEEGIPLAEVQKNFGKIAAIGQGKAFKNKWIKKNGSNLVRLVDSVEDQVQKSLIILQETHASSDKAALKELKSRKLVEPKKLVSFQIEKGPEFSLEVKKQATDLTLEMLQSGEWKSLEFKKYNFDAEGIPTAGGHLHPLLKVREEFRQIFFEMGFEEMPSNCFVDSSFWNFDTLYVPQQHPARDLQDTFFIKDPATCGPLPDFIDKVKQAHESGVDGSIGYRYDWSEAEAKKLVLRTHTTAVSGLMLNRLSKVKPFRPAKYFSIDRVYRNEAVDATHLAEFHQVEGVIADKNMTLGHLISFMDIFFKKMGITNLRFKPAYNPYTEPSLEIFSWHEGFQKWVEIGNSGMFRPEMLIPLGLDPDVRVAGWGLSLERPTMIKYGIDNIRALVGHKVDLSMIKSNPSCRLDKKMGREVFGIQEEAEVTASS
ncbi:Phenylalanyl-tRNA synthetase, beta subunit, cytoplasmic [Mycoemilia scoparia]|uniref:phenylalanine--tRNA ligase n=1 Tax=Mycoemilia scoparia TaxID=417184 RepID=A0A9W8A244_9FUNG|nr:Phenylalanyl-tRNA synthetase, beta subunit, cytoplasmic [Mycoemilia scoparia]